MYDAQGTLLTRRNDNPNPGNLKYDLGVLTDANGDQTLVLRLLDDPDDCTGLRAVTHSRRGKAAARAKLPLGRAS